MLTVAVFSFNRGDYLRNCVESVQRNLPGAAIRIYDDNSDDPATRAVLADLGVPVITPDVSDGGRHGGLYANMQAALMAAQTPWILFLQDDMQVVRPVSISDHQMIEACFATDPRIGFVSPIFIKAVRQRRHERLLQPAAAGRFYVPSDLAGKKLQSRRLAYFDAPIAHVARLAAAGWHFAATEGANVAQARARFSYMPILADPFTFFCPEVPFYRNRSQSRAARLAQRVVGGAVKSLADMTLAEVAQLKARSMAELPIAERFLTTTDPNVRRPFVYKDVAARWWLRALHGLEQKLTRR